MKQISLFLLIIISLYLVSQVDSSLTKDYLPGEGDSDEDIIPKRKNPQTTRKTKQLRTKDLEKKKEDRDKKHLPNDYISKKVVDSESDEIVSQKKRTTHHKKRTTPTTPQDDDETTPSSFQEGRSIKRKDTSKSLGNGTLPLNATGSNEKPVTVTAPPTQSTTTSTTTKPTLTNGPTAIPQGRTIKKKEDADKLTEKNITIGVTPTPIVTPRVTTAPQGRTISRKEDSDKVSEKNISINDGNLSEFASCDQKQCTKLCDGSKLGKCEGQICVCPGFKYIPIEIEGAASSANYQTSSEMACAESCSVRSSYARILIKNNKTKNCVCLTEQMSKSGITFCDSSAEVDVCKRICDTDTATCAFNGICLCRSTWSSFFNLSMKYVRKEISSDSSECSKRCSLYHEDFVGRIYDPQMSEAESKNKTYSFKSKYCLCGPESAILTYNETKEILAAGFQMCSGLICDQRCGMREATCEPQYKRACLCPRENIFIGAHLWSRLPSHAEKFCSDACYAHQLSARVIERNPLLVPSSERFNPWYRRSLFSYQYDGKFCHCIKVEMDMSQFRPCTNEICRWMCEDAEAFCDTESRRGCICNTHKLIGGLGRKSESGEINCDITCRHHLMDAKVLDVVWDTNQLDGWGVTKSKFCGCTKATTPAGLSHCDGGDNDNCPTYCKNKDAYCTREKYCDCGIDHKQLMHNDPVRLPTGPEYEECAEKCRSWLWPFAEDLDSTPFIYDEGRVVCSKTDSCPPVDLSPFDPSTIGFHVDKNIRDEIEPHQPRKFCLCLKSTTIHYKPGIRALPRLTAHNAPEELECWPNHTCSAVGYSIHIK